MGILSKAALGALLFACAASAHAQVSAPRQIREGQTIRGTLEAKEVQAESEWVADVYDLEGRRGQTVTITVSSEDFDAYIDLDKDDEHLAENDDGDDGLDSTLVFEFPENGTYRINVTSAERDETGDYVLRVQRGGQAPSPAPQNTAAPTQRDRPDPQEIRFGQTITSRLTERSPLHTDQTPYLPFTFRGRRGEVVTIEMKAADFDAFLVIKSPSRDDELAKDDDSGGGTDARLVYTLPRDDTYEIRANAVSQIAVGAFTLTLADPKAPAVVTPRSAPATLSISPGQTVRGKLEASDSKAEDGSYFDGYRFSGRQGQRVVVQLRSNDFDAYLALYDAKGDELSTNDDGEGEDGTDSHIDFTLPADGDYVIRANTLTEGETGDYILGLSTR